MLFGAFVPYVAHAQILPPSADSGRIGERVKQLTSSPTVSVAPEILSSPTEPAPAASKNVSLVLHGLVIDGMTVFNPEEMHDIYAPYIDQKITLDVVWGVAAHIRERYQQAGYVLSRAYVPAQHIGPDGIVHLKVVEGYISNVVLDDKARANTQVTYWLQRITQERPLQIDDLESLLLRLNDLPGRNYRAVLEKPQEKDAAEGATQLNIMTLDTPMRARASIDNYGSRYLGPYEGSLLASFETFTNQKTSVSLLNSFRARELNYGSIRQDIPLAYGWAMDMSASRAFTKPGYTLSPEGIEGDSSSYGVGVTREWIRQRQETFSTRLGFDGRDTQSDLLDGQVRLVRDRTRVVRFNADYQRADAADGTNLGNITLSQGIPALGANDRGDADLSRAAARPDFWKAELSYTRVQAVGESWQATGAVAGQISSGPLYSSEEFGYGGQAFGRAYDASEITGDQGAAASVELRYIGLAPWMGVQAAPYGFYDIGRIWNDDAGQPKTASGSSAGAGIKLSTELGISADFGVAFPLTRDMATPLYGDHLRYLMQISYDLH